MLAACGVVCRAPRRRLALLVPDVAAMFAVPKRMHANDGDSNQNPNPIR